MTVYESEQGMYEFRLLPGFADFILKHHLNDYVKTQIDLSFKFKIPLLQYLKHLSKEELFAQSKSSSSELLNYIAANQTKEYLGLSMERWMANQLNIVEKFHIVGEDITLINFVRQESLKTFLPHYTSDIEIILALTTEINIFVLGNNTTASNTYIQILKDRIEEESFLNKNIINASPAITFIFDLVQQRETFITGKVEEVMGFTPEEILDMKGEMISRLAHPEDLEIIGNMMTTILSENSNKTHVFEYRFRDKWDRFHWLRTYIVIFKRNQNGEPTEILGQSFEISREKELLLTLEKREKELLEAQSIAKVGSFDWDFITGTSDYTPEVRRIFETDISQDYQNFLQHVHPEDKQKVQDAMSKGLQDGYYECEYRYLAKSREKVLWARGAITYQNGKPQKMIGTVQDITERKQIEESLLQKTIELQKSNASLQEFASVASHDMKEPLRKIITFSDMVLTEKESLTPSSQLHLQKVIDSATRMKVLIDDILSFSQLGADEAKEKRNLKQMVQEVLTTLEVLIKDKQATIDVSELPDVTVYPSQIQQLFLNLLSNALKFSRPDVPINIKITHTVKAYEEVKQLPVTKASQYIEIRVSDNGIGFSPEAADRIFQLFHRLHNRTEYEGTGLGLAICRKVAENHGGMISASSQSGEGSVFSVLLPMLENFE